MKFFRKSEFCDYLYEHFELERGFIQIMKGEEVGPENDAYLFLYGPPFTHGGKKADFKGQSGAYIFYGVYFQPVEENVIKDLEKWHGQKVLEIVGKHEIWSGSDNKYLEGLEIIARVSEPKGGFWWSKD